MGDKRRDGELLERLCFYRALYSRRGPNDSDAVLTVPATLAYGEMLMRIARRRDEGRNRRGLYQTR